MYLQIAASNDVTAAKTEVTAPVVAVVVVEIEVVLLAVVEQVREVGTSTSSG